MLGNEIIIIVLFAISRLETAVVPHCQGDCSPQLRLDVVLGGRARGTTYKSGLTNSELVKVTLKNSGHQQLDACAHIRVIGAEVLDADIGAGTKDFIYAHLKPGISTTRTLKLNMTRSSRSLDYLRVETLLYCRDGNTIAEDFQFPLSLVGDLVYLTSSPINLTVTEAATSSKNSTLVEDIYEYTVINNGTIFWDNLTAVVTMDNKKLFKDIEVTTTQGKNCTRNLGSKSTLQYICFLNLWPRSSLKIIVATKITVDEIKINGDNGKLEIFSRLDIIFDQISERKTERHVSIFLYEEKLDVGRNEFLIPIIGAVVAFFILFIVCAVFVKRGFLKRKQKKELQSLKESYKQSDEATITEIVTVGDTSLNIDENHDDIQIVEEYPFETVAWDNLAYDHYMLAFDNLTDRVCEPDLHSSTSEVFKSTLDILSHEDGGTVFDNPTYEDCNPVATTGI